MVISRPRPWLELWGRRALEVADELIANTREGRRRRLCKLLIVDDDLFHFQQYRPPQVADKKFYSGNEQHIGWLLI